LEDRGTVGNLMGDEVYYFQCAIQKTEIEEKWGADYSHSLLYYNKTNSRWLTV
jgi:hypothetical protein